MQESSVAVVQEDADLEKIAEEFVPPENRESGD